MFDTPYFADIPLLNAFLQTLLLLVLPLAITLLLGSAAGIWVFFWRNPLFSRSVKPHPFASRPLRYFRSYGYLAFLPLLLLLAQRILGLEQGAASVFVISLGALPYYIFHIHRGLSRLDVSILESALSSGLNKWWIILRVLLPLGKFRLIHAFFETSLFVLSMGAVSGLLTGYGLSGAALTFIDYNRGTLDYLWAYLLLALLFVLAADLSSRFAKKAKE